MILQTDITECYKLTCPYCGAKKRLCCTVAGPGYDGWITNHAMWSDCRIQYNGPSPVAILSIIQQCLSCSKYYFLYDAKEEKDSYTSGAEYFSGELPYQKLKEAFEQLMPTLTHADEIDIRLELVRAHNDLYGGCAGTMDPSEAPLEEQAYFEKNVKSLLLLNGLYPMLRAELLREIGLFDDSLSIINTITDKKWETEKQALLAHVKNNNKSVYIIGNGNAPRSHVERIDEINYSFRAFAKPVDNIQANINIEQAREKSKNHYVNLLDILFAIMIFLMVILVMYHYFM